MTFDRNDWPKLPIGKLPRYVDRGYSLIRTAAFIVRIGAVVVVENAISSLTPVALLRLYAKWLYVFGVSFGVTVGMTLREKDFVAKIM
jgi:hypothetical protein